MQYEPMDDNDWPSGPALKYKMPVGTLACPHCGIVANGLIDEPICGSCDRPYWENNKKDRSIKEKLKRAAAEIIIRLNIIRRQ